jgi:signal transduction histidine kinase
VTDAPPVGDRATRPAPDRPAFAVYFGALALVVLAVVAGGLASSPWTDAGWVAVAAWCLYAAAANVLPVPTSAHIALSMGAPVNLAIAFLFPPGLAAAIVFVASVSEWELKRETTPTHAVFNRLQLAAATALAAGVFSWFGAGGGAGGFGVPAPGVVVVAVVVYQAANWLLVAGAERTARGVGLRRVLRDLLPAGPVAAATYLVLGFMGIVLALTSVRVGPWAVALVMLPLLGARHAVHVSQRLEAAERERRSLADRLVDERERERVRIASDIHDVVLQQLAAVQLEADSIGAALDHDRPDVAVRLAGQVRGGVDEAITELRGTIASLRRDALDAGGLGPSLERVARTFRGSTGVDVRVRVDGGIAGAGGLPLPIALLLVECAQEALTNVARHAPTAAVVDVVVERAGGAVELRVADDGPGFVVPPGAVRSGTLEAGCNGSVEDRLQNPADRGSGRQSGLVLSREKVALSGGLLFVESRPGHGTTVTVRVPVGAPA